MTEFLIVGQEIQVNGLNRRSVSFFSAASSNTVNKCALALVSRVAVKKEVLLAHLRSGDATSLKPGLLRRFDEPGCGGHLRFQLWVFFFLRVFKRFLWTRASSPANLTFMIFVIVSKGARSTCPRRSVKISSTAFT